MKKNAFRSLLLVAAIVTLGAGYGKVSIDLPADPYHFKPGPGAAAATANCITCHSAAYVYTQPRLTRVQWTAEVKKMKAAYGAPIADESVDAIVDYLMTQNGKP